MVITKIKPTFTEELQLWQQGYAVIGVDEVGRGCFAGPLVAAAVCFPPSIHDLPPTINDSKLLSAPMREKLSEIIKKRSQCYAIEEIDVATINAVGIGKATALAFGNAIKKMQASLINGKVFTLLDGKMLSTFAKSQYHKAIIRGDRLSISIAAASIIAKVYRDNRMREFHTRYPHYNFAQNKGYGTKDHQQALQTYGLSTLHRTSFNIAKFCT